MNKIPALIFLILLSSFTKRPAFATPQAGKGPVKPITLRHNFIKIPPYHFYVTKKGNIYVEDNSDVLEFTPEGTFKARIKLPLVKSYFLGSFIISDDEHEIYYFSADRPTALIGYNLTTHKIFYKSVYKGCTILRTDKNGVFYSMYQDYPNGTGNPVQNLIRVFDKSGRNYAYPTSLNLEASNVEVIGSNLAIFTSDQTFNLLPVINQKNQKPARIKLPGLSSYYGKLLGVINNKYIFCDHSDKTDKDRIDVYDSNFKRLKSYPLDFLFSETIARDNEGDLHSDFPSGNIYQYDNNNHIYFMRNTMKGTFIYNLEDFLNN